MSAFKGDNDVIGPNPRGVRGESFQINANPSGTKLVYGCAKTVVVRDFANPGVCQIYTGHKLKVTAVKFNSTGNALGSCDASGAFHMLEIKKSGLIEQTKVLQGLGGSILDFAWYPQDNKIAVGGEAKPSGRCMTLSGLDQGTMSESFKRVMSVDVRRSMDNTTACMASYDGSVRFYTGSAPKLEKTIEFTSSKKPVECIRCSPDGRFYIASAGKEIKLIDAQSGEVVQEWPEVHKGTVYALSWSPDSKNVITCGSDGTVKLWDIAAAKVVSSFDCNTSPEKIDNFQIGCTYAGENMVSLAMSGNISYLDKGSGKVASVVEAHTGPVKSLAFEASSKTKFSLFSIDDAGAVHRWDGDGKGTTLRGSDDKHIHGSPGLLLGLQKGLLYSVAMDDVLKISDSNGKELSSVKLASQARGIAIGQNGIAVVATKNKVYLVDGEKIANPVDVSFEIVAVGISPDNKEIAIGGSDNMVHLFALSGGAITDLKKNLTKEPLIQPITCIDITDKLIAVGTKNKYVKVFDRKTSEAIDENKMCFNTSSITDLKFSPSKQHLAVAGADGSAYVYKVDSPATRIDLTKIHTGGVSALIWTGANELYTSGSLDGSIRRFELKL